MIRYYPKSLLLSSEIPGKTVLLFHALTGCPFHCHECLNYASLIETVNHTYFTVNQIIDVALKQQTLIDYVIISGAEILNAPVDDLVYELSLVKSMTQKPLIIYTTGVYDQKLSMLIQMGIVDGIHIDMKLPYHLLTTEDDELIRQTFGKTVSMTTIQQMLKSIQLVVKYDQGLSQIRSVIYPFMHASAYGEIEQYIAHLNQTYHKQTPYYRNPFITSK